MARDDTMTPSKTVFPHRNYVPSHCDAHSINKRENPRLMTGAEGLVKDTSTILLPLLYQKYPVP